MQCVQTTIRWQYWRYISQIEKYTVFSPLFPVS